MNTSTRDRSCQAQRRRRRLHPAAVTLSVLVAALAASGIAPAEERFQCALTESSGLSDADAATATRLVCDELRRESGGRGEFSVSLRTLGSLVMMTASRADTATSVTVRATGLEEIPLAASRVAEALVRGRAFASTQRVDNLTRDETREALSKKGSVKFFLGVADVESLGHGARGAGFSIGLVYASPRFSLPAEMRFGWDDASYGEKQIDLFSISVGARRYFSKRDVSPFAGAGLGILKLSASEGGDDLGGDYFHGDRFGVAAYVEGGVEMLRLHRARFGIHVRADIPTGSLHSEGGIAFDERGVPIWSRMESRRYVVPVTIGLNLAF